MSSIAGTRVRTGLANDCQRVIYRSGRSGGDIGGDKGGCENEGGGELHGENIFEFRSLAYLYC